MTYMYNICRRKVSTVYNSVGPPHMYTCRPWTLIRNSSDGVPCSGLWQYRARIHHLKIPGHSLLRGTICRCHFVQSSLLTASRETWRHSYIMQLSFLNNFALFSSFTVLGALLVPLGHLCGPNLDCLWYDTWYEALAVVDTYTHFRDLRIKFDCSLKVH